MPRRIKRSARPVRVRYGGNVTALQANPALRLCCEISETHGNIEAHKRGPGGSACARQHASAKLSERFVSCGAKMLRLFARNLGFVFFAFAASAYVNVVPQIVFARSAPDAKSLWLSATLLVGTFASMAAVEVARRVGYGARPWLTGNLITLVILSILFAAGGVTQPLVFAALCITLRALCQYASQESDRRAAVLAGSTERGRNDAISLVLRFAGMLGGPLFMGLHSELDALSTAVFLALAGLALISVAAVAQAPQNAVKSEEDRASDPEPRLRPSDRRIIWAARLIFACYAMLTACVLYALRDLHGLTAAARHGSTLITAAFAAAMLATPFLAVLYGRGNGQYSLLGMLPAPIAIAAAGLLLPLPSAGRIGPGLVGAAVLGIAFAAFQLSFRDYASKQALESGRKELLAIFNNLANTSALVAFGAMLLLSLSARALAYNSARTVLVGLTALGLAASLATALVQHAQARARHVSMN